MIVPWFVHFCSTVMRTATILLPIDFVPKLSDLRLFEVTRKHLLKLFLFNRQRVIGRGISCLIHVGCLFRRSGFDADGIDILLFCRLGPALI